jgi:hypothetical protein
MVLGFSGPKFASKLQLSQQFHFAGGLSALIGVAQPSGLLCNQTMFALTWVVEPTLSVDDGQLEDFVALRFGASRTKA